MTNASRNAATCPLCGSAIEAVAPHALVSGEHPEAIRYDLEKMMAEAAKDRVHDESVKVRVTQEDIRKLMEKRRKAK